MDGPYQRAYLQIRLYPPEDSGAATLELMPRRSVFRRRAAW